MNIENLSLSDSPLTTVVFNNESKSIILHSEFGYDTEFKQHIYNVNLHIQNWNSLRIYKFVSDDDFKSYNEVEVDYQNGYETFDMIQKLDLNNVILKFEGFSRESKNWLVYEFVNAQTDVTFK